MIVTFQNLESFESIHMVYSFIATAPKGGVVMLKEIITLVVAPLFVALVTTLVDHWLDNRDDN